MCQKSPGPRCAGGIKESRQALEARSEALIAKARDLAGTPGSDEKMTDLARRRFELVGKAHALDDEFNETPEGQGVLNAKIARMQASVEEIRERRAALAATVPDGVVHVDDPRVDVDRLNAEPQVDAWTGEPVSDPKTYVAGPAPTAGADAELNRAVRDLVSEQSLAYAARARYRAKQEAGRCERRGDMAGSQITQQWGAGTAWTKHSSVDLMSRSLDRNKVAVSPALLVSVDDGDTSVEEDNEGRGYVVRRHEFVVEQPVTETVGQQYVVGRHPDALYDPVVVDAQRDSGEVVRMTPSGVGGKSYAPSEIGSHTGYEDTVRELAEVQSGDDVRVTWGTARLTRDASGSLNVLQMRGEVEIVTDVREMADRHEP